MSLINGRFRGYTCMEDFKQANDRLKQSQNEHLKYDDEVLKYWEGDVQHRLYLRNSEDDYIGISTDRTINAPTSKVKVEHVEYRGYEFQVAVLDGRIIAIMEYGDEHLFNDKSLPVHD